jgi:P pilus assembly chaperone PapD
MKRQARHPFLLMLALFASALAVPAVRAAGGDLLVAPTRLIVREGATAEVLLGNKGTEPATYRITLLMKKMLPDGTLADVPEAEGAQSPVLDLISYAPRKVVLAPGQTQTVRVAMRAGAALADGEYRVHLLFRAVPDPITAAAAPASNNGLAIALVPVYGVTIPVIIRKGDLKAAARIGDVRLVNVAGKPAVAVDVVRTGNRSVYGALHVMRPGDAKPIVSEKIAVYTELNKRTVTIRLPEGPPPKGPVTVSFGEDGDGADKVSVEAQVTL